MSQWPALLLFFEAHPNLAPVRLEIPFSWLAGHHSPELSLLHVLPAPLGCPGVKVISHTWIVSCFPSSAFCLPQNVGSFHSFRGLAQPLRLLFSVLLLPLFGYCLPAELGMCWRAGWFRVTSPSTSLAPAPYLRWWGLPIARTGHNIFKATADAFPTVEVQLTYPRPLFLTSFPLKCH